MARIRKHRNKWQVLYRDPATHKERSAGVFTRKGDANRVGLSAMEWGAGSTKDDRRALWLLTDTFDPLVLQGFPGDGRPGVPSPSLLPVHRLPTRTRRPQ
jgi:hypothetical protein